MLNRALLTLLLAAVASGAWPHGHVRAFERADDDVRQQRPPSGPPSGRQQPVVDPLTASISGRVTTLDSGAPIRRAEIRAIASSGFSRLATTDNDGRYTLRDMPAGSYRLTISKSGFVTLIYGQRRPFEAATQVDLKHGQQFTASVALPRGGAIAGRVYDEAGEPVAAVRVQALRTRIVDGRRRVEPAGAGDLTDDTGAFRLYGLGPADYYVSATAPNRAVPRPTSQLERAMPPGNEGTQTLFYPGTASLNEAQRVTLTAGSEARADIQLAQVRAATVSGIVLRSSGEPAADATVSLRSETIALGLATQISGPPPMMISGHTDASGAFVLSDVPPGSYTLQAMIQNDRPFTFRAPPGATADDPAGNPLLRMEAPPLPDIATMPLVVTGDLAGVMLAATQGGSVEGLFVADAGVTQALPRGLEVTPRWVTGSDASMRMVGAPAFRLFGLNGTGYLSVAGLPEGWAVRSMIADGEDVTDRLLDFTRGQSLNLRVVLTDRVTTVIGIVADSVREPGQRANQNVVVFPEDSSKWTPGSRHLRTVRTDDQGTFRITGLPPGERYLAVAVDFLEDGEGTDPEFLEQVRSRATGFSLADAERRALDLRLLQR